MRIPDFVIEGDPRPREGEPNGVVFFGEIVLSVDEAGDVNIDAPDIDEPLFIPREEIAGVAQWFAALAKATGETA